MKKIFYLIPLFLLFLIPKVYALPNCNSISSATLYDVYNANSVGSISTNSIKSSTDLLCGNAWWSGATSDNTQGLGWEVKLADLNAKDFYYQLNVYYHIEDVGGGTPNVIASPFRYNNIAVGTSNASSLWTSGNLGVTDLSYTINTYSIENGYTYYVVSYVFKATTGFNRLFLPFATSYLYSGSYYLSGIDITNIGSKSLSSTEINSLLANQSSQIQTEINNMETNINNTINDNFNTCRDSVNVFDVNNINVYSTNNANYTTGNDALRVFSTGSYSSIDLLLDLEIGKTYTFSADVVNTLTDGRANVSIFTLDYSNRYVEQYVFTQSGRFNMTFTPVSSPTLFRIYSNASNDILDNYVTLSNIQVQLGNSATNYEPYGEICQNKIDETNDKLDNVNDSINDLNSSINDSNSSGATDSAGSFFQNFEDNDFGLSGIITAPLNTIKTITSNSCTPINLTIPFVNKNMSLPCMTDIYEEHFGSFLDIYQIITFGIISYWVCVQIYAMVKGFKNPDKDEIEVMDL